MPLSTCSDRTGGPVAPAAAAAASKLLLPHAPAVVSGEAALERGGGGERGGPTGGSVSATTVRLTIRLRIGLRCCCCCCCRASAPAHLAPETASAEPTAATPETVPARLLLAQWAAGRALPISAPSVSRRGSASGLIGQLPAAWQAGQSRYMFTQTGCKPTQPIVLCLAISDNTTSWLLQRSLGPPTHHRSTRPCRPAGRRPGPSPARAAPGAPAAPARAASSPAGRARLGRGRGPAGGGTNEAKELGSAGDVSARCYTLTRQDMQLAVGGGPPCSPAPVLYRFASTSMTECSGSGTPSSLSIHSCRHGFSRARESYKFKKPSAAPLRLHV